MPGFVLQGFRGIAPKTNPAYLRPGVGSVAIDCSFRAGTIKPRRKSRLIKKIYAHNKLANGAAGGLAVFPNGTTWGTYRPCQQCAYGERIFVAGDEDSGGNDLSPYFLKLISNEVKDYKLGVEPPNGMALSASVSGGSGTSFSVVYAIAIETADGDESDLFGEFTATGVYAESVVTISVSAIANNTNLSFNAVGAKVNIYATSRSATASSDFRFIGQWNFSTARAGATFTDRQTTLRNEKKEIYSGSTLPPSGLKKIMNMPGGFMVGHDGENVYFSEIGKPSVWPPDYKIAPPAGGKIIGMSVSVEQIYVMTENDNPFVITALTPSSAQVYFTSVEYPCIAGDTVIRFGNGVVYAGKSGLIQLQGSNGVLLTKPVLDEETFEPYISTNARALTFSDGTIVLYGGSKRLLIDHQGGDGIDLSEITPDISDAKELSGKMLYVSGGALYEYEGDTEPEQARWKSGILRNERPHVLNNLRVFANYKTVGGIKTFGGIASAVIAGLKNAFTKPKNNNIMEDALVRVNIYAVYEGNIEIPVGGEMLVRYNWDIPISSYVPSYDYQIEITSRSEVEKIELTATANF